MIYKPLSSLSSISKHNNNIIIINLCYMFYNCEFLSSLPDISKWNTKKATDISFMFYNCRSLI